MLLLGEPAVSSPGEPTAVVEVSASDLAFWDERPADLTVRDISSGGAMDYALGVAGNAVVQSVACDKDWAVPYGFSLRRLEGRPFAKLPFRLTPAMDVNVVVQVLEHAGPASALCTIVSSVGPRSFHVTDEAR